MAQLRALVPVFIFILVFSSCGGGGSSSSNPIIEKKKQQQQKVEQKNKQEQIIQNDQGKEVVEPEALEFILPVDALAESDPEKYKNIKLGIEKSIKAYPGEWRKSDTLGQIDNYYKDTPYLVISAYVSILRHSALPPNDGFFRWQHYHKGPFLTVVNHLEKEKNVRYKQKIVEDLLPVFKNKKFSYGFINQVKLISRFAKLDPKILDAIKGMWSTMLQLEKEFAFEISSALNSLFGFFDELSDSNKHGDYILKNIKPKISNVCQIMFESYHPHMGKYNWKHDSFRIRYKKSCENCMSMWQKFASQDTQFFETENASRAYASAALIYSQSKNAYGWSFRISEIISDSLVDLYKGASPKAKKSMLDLLEMRMQEDKNFWQGKKFLSYLSRNITKDRIPVMQARKQAGLNQAKKNTGDAILTIKEELAKEDKLDSDVIHSKLYEVKYHGESVDPEGSYEILTKMSEPTIYKKLEYDARNNLLDVWGEFGSDSDKYRSQSIGALKKLTKEDSSAYKSLGTIAVNINSESKTILSYLMKQLESVKGYQKENIIIAVGAILTQYPKLLSVAFFNQMIADMKKGNSQIEYVTHIFSQVPLYNSVQASMLVNKLIEILPELSAKRRDDRKDFSQIFRNLMHSPGYVAAVAVHPLLDWSEKILSKVEVDKQKREEQEVFRTKAYTILPLIGIRFPHLAQRVVNIYMMGIKGNQDDDLYRLNYLHYAYNDNPVLVETKPEVFEKHIPYLLSLKDEDHPKRLETYSRQILETLLNKKSSKENRTNIITALENSIKDCKDSEKENYVRALSHIAQRLDDESPQNLRTLLTNEASLDANVEAKMYAMEALAFLNRSNDNELYVKSAVKAFKTFKKGWSQVFVGFTNIMAYVKPVNGTLFKEVIELIQSSILNVTQSNRFQKKYDEDVRANGLKVLAQLYAEHTVEASEFISPTLFINAFEGQLPVSDMIIRKSGLAALGTLLGHELNIDLLDVLDHKNLYELTELKLQALDVLVSLYNTHADKQTVIRSKVLPFLNDKNRVIRSKAIVSLGNMNPTADELKDLHARSNNVEEQEAIGAVLSEKKDVKFVTEQLNIVLQTEAKIEKRIAAAGIVASMDSFGTEKLLNTIKSKEDSSLNKLFGSNDELCARVIYCLSMAGLESKKTYQAELEAFLKDESKSDVIKQAAMFTLEKYSQMK